MNITFLIGNGFDLNLGLDTSYNSFIKEYTKDIDNTEDDGSALYYFKKNISRNKELWSSAEEAIGQITAKFKSDEKNADDFSNCHSNFCQELAEYLANQEQRIDFNANKDKVAQAFAKALNHYENAFRETEKNAILNARSSYDGGFEYNFINFNYTNTLKLCVNSLKGSSDLIGKRKYNASTTYSNSLGKIINVHGTLTDDMVFGVHDKTQIADTSLFDGYGDEYISQIIKSKTDSYNKQNTYKKARAILEKSHLIYVYGMSTGITDKYWWEKLCSWLANSAQRHLILHKFEAPKRGVISREYNTFERTTREDFLSFCNLEKSKKDSFINRIHIDDSNIFEGLSKLAKEDETADEKELTTA